QGSSCPAQASASFQARTAPSAGTWCYRTETQADRQRSAHKKRRLDVAIQFIQSADRSSIPDDPYAAARQHTLGDLLRRTAARFPGKTAIVCGNVSWTYREFDTVCNRVANGLAARGITTGDRVAILSRNSHAFAAM